MKELHIQPSMVSSLELRMDDECMNCHSWAPLDFVAPITVGLIMAHLGGTFCMRYVKSEGRHPCHAAVNDNPYVHQCTITFGATRIVKIGWQEARWRYCGAMKVWETAGKRCYLPGYFCGILFQLGLTCCWRGGDSLSSLSTQSPICHMDLSSSSFTLSSSCRTRRTHYQHPNWDC